MNVLHTQIVLLLLREISVICFFDTIFPAF